jgi:superfamily II DNA or RNA helicase
LDHFNGKYRLGLTATPERKDGLAHMIFKLLGPQCVYVKRTRPEYGLWKFTMLDYYNPKHKGNLTKNNYGKTENDHVEMRRRVCDDTVRAGALAKFMVDHLDKDVLVFGDWKDSIHSLTREVEKLRRGSTYVLVGGGSKSKKAKLEKEHGLAKKPYIIATIAKAGTGLNVKRLNCVVFMSDRNPDRLLEQGSGRALRKKCPKHMYYVNDVATPYLSYKAKKCQTWFAKEGFQIMPSVQIGDIPIPGSIQASMSNMSNMKRKVGEETSRVYKRKRK